MSRIKITACTSSEHLYPVSQDLTDIEYGIRAFGSGTLGGFALEDLAIPIANVRPLPTSPSMVHGKRKTPCRGHSLLHFPSSIAKLASSVNHKRSSSVPNSVNVCPTDDTSTTVCSGKENVKTEVDPTSFDDVFVLTRPIYRSTVSSVWECIHREKGSRYCVKMIDKRRFRSRADEESALREIEILTSVQAYRSPHFPRLVKLTEDKYLHYLVMEYVEGGSLAALRQTKQHLSEDQISALARSLLLGLDELHRSHVAHFNLTLENILVRPNFCDVVLCDFGAACDFKKNANLCKGTTTTVGRVSGSAAYNTTETYGPRVRNLHYAAPEFIGAEKKVGLAADMWSVGVVLYELFCGGLPFDDRSNRAVKQNIVSAKYHFSGKEWHEVSRGAKQLISILLHPDPHVRMTVGEALNHPWIMGDTYYPQDISPIIPRRSTSLVQRLWGKVRSKPSTESNYSNQQSLSSVLPSSLESSSEHPEIINRSSTYSTC